MFVFCIDERKNPVGLIPPKQARAALEKKEAAVFKQHPFCLMFKGEKKPVNQDLILKIDPGYKFTGLAIMDGDSVLWAAQIKHHGKMISANMESRRAIRRNRRSRNTPFRKPRFSNRVRKDDWMPPSLTSIISNIITWVKRIKKLCLVKEVWVEVNKFDVSKMVGIKDYQKGPLFGFKNAREMLIESSDCCFYCKRPKDFLKKVGIPLEQDHFVPKSKGGTDRSGNMVLSCRECNLQKGNKNVSDERIAKQSLRGASVMNQLRFKLTEMIAALDLPVKSFPSKMTYENRLRIYGDIKTSGDKDACHWIDAICVGDIRNVKSFVQNVLIIESRGHGSRQMCITDKYGFPKTHRKRQRKFFGIRTGDLVRNQENGKTGFVTAARSPRTEKSKSSSIEVKFPDGKRNVTSSKLEPLQKSDGYMYSFQAPIFFPLEQKRERSSDEVS